jgi:hypothetical protein
MAFTPNNFLTQTSQATLRDQQHAARLFTDDQFRLAPKHKFLFHVAFNINPAALQSIELVQRYKNEINMLVKSCDLPNFTINTETLNQYNRKKNVQTGMKYNPLSIVFHDDNMGLINQLWQNYYSYYYADTTSAVDAGAYDRTATKNFNYFNNTYGLDNGSVQPFFNYITIYQMARHEYVSYRLHNPIITQWNHNKLDYAQGQNTHDNTAQIAFEAVSYDRGVVNSENVEGFGAEHYDQTPSTLQGLSDPGAIKSSLVGRSNVTNNASQFLSNLAGTVNGYQNTQTLGSAAQTGLLNNTLQTAQQGVSGVQGIAFPVASTTAAGTVAAKQVNLGI